MNPQKTNTRDHHTLTMPTTTNRVFAHTISKIENSIEPNSDRATYTKAGIAAEVGKHPNTMTRYNVLATSFLWMYMEHCRTGNDRIASNLSISSYQRQVLIAISKLYDRYSASASAEEDVKKTLSKYSEEFNNVSFNCAKFFRDFID